MSPEKRTLPLALRRIKAYLKLALAVAVIVIGWLVVAYNRDHQTDVWFFVTYKDVNVVWLMFVTALVTLVLGWGTLRLAGLWRELRQLRREEREKKRMAEQQRLASELAEREKRIDEKVRQAIRDQM